ncbi:hypothetical protein Kpol_1023p29 [Vanderwaltozyma polyspora DSM 70294]|uniref:Bromo domain-containing protein n=1 Tax=Vanderwaltozyma polyspora (strain ATCC 22028 / DSM 70294 / BCRC 21397 / CBS 2163 / NBRC 10782 / NRRL Y-8283 / UCD 57-17) TaxID=436907 RepID=A7TFQ2_VANPO|nr:uncharacterized protein Kpol_1023p29 [Vanderwaltozyma polyspora DSM 70294]EDO18860.1 hypothetical protein Kpol_1023p29 [Vanderwaltozyma polyspora DSM 70294]
MQVEELLDNIFTIYKAASVKCKVLEEEFPADFFEDDPAKIYESYLGFLQNNTVVDGNFISNNQLKLTTINAKYENKEYNVDNGFYKLYHDIKLVCTMLVHYYPQGTRNYQIIDKFYKFATELLIRECYRLGVQLSENLIRENEANESNTELENLIKNDFIKISTNYKVPIMETYHIKTRDHELFSSVIAKSILDNRPREVPNSNFEINKIIPQTNMREEAPKLGFVAANTSNIPDPTFPPTEMMTRFLHPNWYSLPVATWLKYGDFKSWAPFCSENSCVSNIGARGKLWLETIGYIKLYQKETKTSESTEPTEKIENEKIGIDDEKEREDKNEDEAKADNNEEKKLETKEDDSLYKDTPIKLENLLKWNPSNYISDNELKAFQDGTQSQLISNTLLKLQKIRKQRIHDKSVRKPSKEEMDLYYKVKRLMREVLLSKQKSKLACEPCTSFPIIQANYNGSIPVVRSQPNRKRKYTRRI